MTMKMSVSIPEALWIKVRILRPESTTSGIIQEALRKLVESEEPTTAQVQDFWKSL